jgi:hypothetical protein
MVAFTACETPYPFRLAQREFPLDGNGDFGALVSLWLDVVNNVALDNFCE